MGRYKSQNIRGTWTMENMIKAITDVKNGKKVATSAKLNNVPRRTLRRYLQEKKFTKSTLGRKPLLSAAQEHLLASRVIRLCNVGYPLTQRVLRTCVKTFCDRNNIPAPSKGLMVGRDWLRGFLKRHQNISKRKVQNLNPARAQKMNKLVVTDYFSKLKILLEENDIMNKPERIFNVDEKGCQLNLHKSPQVLAQRGSKRVHLVAPEHGENVTIVSCANALGNAIPPMILFKGKRMKPEWLESLPTGAVAQMTPKGSMNTETFVNWLHHFAKYKLSGRCLLIFDGAKCHLDYSIVEIAEKFNIKLFCLPSNTTHELQPMDKSVFRSFEYYWDEEVLKYWSVHEDRRITKHRFGIIFSRVWDKAATPTNIKAGFEATGIYPFNPDSIPEEAYAPSIPTFNPLSPECHIENQENKDPSDSDATDASESLLTQVPMHLLDYVSEHFPSPQIKNSNNDSVPVEVTNIQINDVLPGTSSAENEHFSYSDDVPLSEIRQKNQAKNDHEPHSVSYQSFCEMLKTPKKISSPKAAPRAKAINSLARELTKSTFADKKNIPGSSKVLIKKKKNVHGPSNTAPKKKSKSLATTFNTKQHASKTLSSMNNAQTSKESWYCFICREDKVADMRICFACSTYVHEECVGLTAADKDDFMCIMCSKD